MVLAVDLDKTLLKTDIFFESFLKLIFTRWNGIFYCLYYFFRGGRLSLKIYLSENINLDASSLPYNIDVLNHIKEWKEDGKECILISGSSQKQVDQVSNYLNIFDNSYGSNSLVNLKGKQKRDFLIRKYGMEGFEYMGDSYADLSIFKAAINSFVINPSLKLTKTVTKMNLNIKIISTKNNIFSEIFKSMRIHQWIKNLLVFVPMLATHSFSYEVLKESVFAFIAFSFAASSVYIFNDLVDLDSDRKHFRKKNRPFASGALDLRVAFLMIPTLFLTSILISIFFSYFFQITLILYFVLTMVYTLFLKKLFVIDICLISSLYTLRVISGYTITDTSFSVWLLTFSIFIFFSLASVKRLAELKANKESQNIKIDGRGYYSNDAQVISQMSLTSGYISVLVMLLYLNSSNVSRLYNFPEALWGICIILLFWISRIIIITNRGYMHDDPVVFAAKDWVSIVCGMLCISFGVLAAIL